MMVRLSPTGAAAFDEIMLNLSRGGPGVITKVTPYARRACMHKGRAEGDAVCAGVRVLMHEYICVHVSMCLSFARARALSFPLRLRLALKL